MFSRFTCLFNTKLALPHACNVVTKLPPHHGLLNFFFLAVLGKEISKNCLGFLRNFVQSFYIAEDGSHVGVVLFSSTAEVMLNFEKYFYSDLMMDAIDKIPYPAKSTYTGIGLDLVRTGLFEISERQGVRDILIVITDGASRVRFICNNNQRAQPPKNTSEPLKNKTS